MAISKSMSFKGFSLKKLVAKNMMAIRAFGAAAIAAVNYYVVPLSQPWNTLVASFVALLSYLALSALDFYISEVQA